MSEPFRLSVNLDTIEALYTMAINIPDYERHTERVVSNSLTNPDKWLAAAMSPAQVKALCEDWEGMRIELDRLRTQGVPDDIMAFIDSAAAAIANAQIGAERQRADSWMEAGNKLYEIRSALRNSDDTPEDHAEFFKQACRIVFGPQDEEESDG